MAAGFRAGEMQSAGGRKIKKTPKVRQILGDSLLFAFDEAVDDQHELERRLRLMITNECSQATVNSEYEVWLDGRENVLGVLEELKGYVADADYAECFARYEQLTACYEAVEADVANFCGFVDAVDSKKDVLKGILSQARELESEIKSMEQELTRSLNIGSDLHSSTPRAPPIGLGTNRGPPDLSRVPTADPVSTETARPIVTLQPLPPAQPVMDSTSAALNRLATVLEGQRHGGEGSRGKLPRVEPDIFKGDLVLFSSWWSAFELMVESRAKTESEKLFYLHKYTAGPPNDSIKGFLSLYDDETSYRKARNVLITRYGNRLKIADAFKDKLRAWPAVKETDGHGLQAFADFLWQCHSAMTSLDYLANLNSQEENAKLTLKLPKATADRWERLVDEAVFGEEPDLTEEPSHSGLVGRYPTFHEFCRFVAKEARILVNSADRPGVAKDSSQSRRKATALATDVKPKQSKAPAKEEGKSSRQPFCLFCKGTHWVDTCRDLLDKTSEFKRGFARERNLCFGCLRRGHTFNTCRTRDPAIMRDGCMGDPPTPARGGVVTLHTSVDMEGVYSSSVLPVWCYVGDNEEQRFLVYAVLDSQSSGCFISEELAELLQVEPERVSLELVTLGSKKKIRCGAIEGLKVKGQHEEEAIHLPRCYTRPTIPGLHEYIPRPDKVRLWPHLREVWRELPQPRPDVSFGLLIGFNCGEALCADEYVRGERSQPFAVKSVLGWSITGCLERPVVNPYSCFGLKTDVREINMQEVGRAFDQDFESPEPGDRKLSQEDAKFLEIARKGIVQLPDSHFQLPLPFKEEPGGLPDSRPMAMRRLMSVKRKMVNNAQFREQYAAFMSGLIDTGKAHPVQLPDEVPSDKRWYWPNHGVVHPLKPGKVRGTFDGAAEVAGVSINSKLLSGPDMTNNLVGVIARFHREKVAITCDIEGMFLQVRVAPEHRDYLRFLWFQGGDPGGEIIEYYMAVHLFGAASSLGMAGVALKETARRFQEEFGAEAASFVKDDFYVDDGLGSTQDDEKALALVHNSRGLCAAGGFNLHKFASSSRAVMAAIPIEWRAASLKDLEFCTERMPNERTLGVLMSLEQDAFIYRVQLLARPDTRRGYLSALSSIFDPMGLAAPALLPGRLLLQELCADKLGWDQMVDEDGVRRWQEWYAELIQLNQLEVPRCVRQRAELPLARVELHTFADASSKGYGACCYLLLQDEAGRMDTTLVYAKSRVAPNKPTTIPRLELQAAVLAVKMGRFMEAELKYGDMKCHFWSDSTVVLGYISNEARRFHIYVANRSQFIRSHTELRQWHHICTERNPADLASRGVTAEELVHNQLWWQGPVDMGQGEFNRLHHVPVQPNDPELKKRALAMTTIASSQASTPFLQILSRVSRWSAAIMVVKVWMTYMDKLRTPGTSKTTVTRQDEARKWLLRQAQMAGYENEVRLLTGREYPESGRECRDRKAMLRPESNLYRLDVYSNSEGLLRVGGRLRRSGWPRDIVHPIIVPGGHELGRRLIEHCHEQTQHMGAGITLGAVRQAGYWLVGGRSAVARVVGKCVLCRRHRGAPVEQRMADLPEDRFYTGPPFTHVAADMFGPFLIKVGRSQVKWWICVFVCMASRAIHLEPVKLIADL